MDTKHRSLPAVFKRLDSKTYWELMKIAERHDIPVFRPSVTGQLVQRRRADLIWDIADEVMAGEVVLE